MSTENDGIAQTTSSSVRPTAGLTESRVDATKPDMRDASGHPAAVWKYPLRTFCSDVQSVSLGEHSRVLSVAMQGRSLQMWALNYTDEPQNQTRWFYVAGTGHTLPDTAMIFVGTVLDGGFVWHVWEIVG